MEIILFLSCLIYVLLFRNGGFWKKIFWIALIESLFIGIGLLSITLLSIMTGVSVIDIMTKSSNVRLIVMVITHIIDFVVFFILSINKKRNELLFNPSLIICFIIPLISLISVIVAHQILLKDVNNGTSEVLIYIVSVSYILTNIIVFILYEIINKEAEKNYDLMAKQKQYEITEKHNNQIIEIYSNIKDWRHDYVNHMQVIMNLLEKPEVKDFNKEAINYIKNLDEKIEPSLAMISTGNYIVDAIVSAKVSSASLHNIKFEYNISLPERLAIKDTDLCAVLSNLLDNAIEACLKLKYDRCIHLVIIILKNDLFIKLENSTNGEYKREYGQFKTTKKGKFHGIGMKHIESIVKEYSGIYSIEAENNSFSTQITIPLVAKGNI